MTLSLSPSEIRYSQDSISHKFSDGHLLTSTFARLISGQLSVSSLPTLECILKDGNWYVASGNRRLFLYKKLQEAGALSTVTAMKSHNTRGKNFTTKCNGVYVRCRGSALEYQIQEIISQWKRGENVVTKWGTAPVSPTVRRSSRYDDFDLDDFCGDVYCDSDDPDDYLSYSFAGLDFDDY